MLLIAVVFNLFDQNNDGYLEKVGCFSERSAIWRPSSDNEEMDSVCSWRTRCALLSCFKVNALRK